MRRSIPCTVEAWRKKKGQRQHGERSLESQQTKRAYINNTAKGPNRICPVQDITANGGILHDDTGRHDRILRGICQLLQDQVDHLSQRGILILEEFRDTEEQRGGLVRGELFPSKHEDTDLGQESATYSRRDGRGIEQPCCRETQDWPVNKQQTRARRKGSIQQLTILNYGGPIKPDHDRIGILIFLNVTHYV